MSRLKPWPPVPREHEAMDTRPDNQSEQERIRKVYRAWHGGAALARYAWHRPEILQQVAARSRVFAELLSASVGADLSGVKVLDVGCGTGGFVRQLIDWGATPDNITATELQKDRLDHARRCTAPGVHWHLGPLDGIAQDSADLVTAQTVFSSILTPGLRRELAAQMWRTLRPGGWCLIFDFRYSNPRNRNVRKVTRAELEGLWPGGQRRYRSLILAPPVNRLLAWAPYLVPEVLALAAPVLRSHFMYLVRKDV
ncbi:class I SAM-dependent methyltransferase [Massilia sp. KIM]|uniref:class I SAM-dependent methyltransferase n=1 Tax=Massilia sp. KIM TaxID=1955422 RepID=UPI001E64C34B|nr:class I SAM-dependent methyltransferase [Massilia sp. KIM]